MDELSRQNGDFVYFFVYQKFEGLLFVFICFAYQNNSEGFVSVDLNSK